MSVVAERQQRCEPANSAGGGKFNSLTTFGLGGELAEQQVHLARVGEYLRDGGAGPADVEIILKNGSRKHVHSIVLGAHSKYFANKKPFPTRIDASFARHCSIIAVVDYLYTGRIRMRLTDLPDFLHTCNEWQLPGLRKMLETKLTQVSFEVNCLIHCLNIAGSPRANVSLASRGIIINNCLNNFVKILEDHRFTNLKPDAIELILTQDKLPVNSELDVARILLLLYAHPTANRPHIEGLLFVLRREHLTDEQKDTIIQELHRLDPSLVPAVQNYFNNVNVPPGTRPYVRGIRKGNSTFPRTLEKILVKHGVRSIVPASPHSPNPYSRRSQASYGSPLNSFADSIVERGRLPDPFIPQSPAASKDGNAYRKADPSQRVVNRFDLTRDSVYELNQVPDLFGSEKPATVILPNNNNYGECAVVPFSNAAKNSAAADNSSTFSCSAGSVKPTDSLADLAAIPCPFVEAQGGKTVNKRLVSKNSYKEIRRLPNVSQSSSKFNTVSSSSDNSADERSESTLSGSTARSSMRSFVDSSHAGIVRRYSNTSLKDLAAIPSLSQISIGDAPTSGVVTAQSPGPRTQRVVRNGFPDTVQVRYPAENGWSAYGNSTSASQPTSGVSTCSSFTNSMAERARAAGCPAFTGEQPSSDVTTALSFGEQTRDQVNHGNFTAARQRPMQYPAAADWNAYGQVASSVAAPSSQCLSLSAFSPAATSSPSTSASSVTTADVYKRALPRYVPTNESLVDIHALPNPFDQNYVPAAGFTTIRKPSNASSFVSSSQSSVSSGESRP